LQLHFVSTSNSIFLSLICLIILYLVVKVMFFHYILSWVWYYQQTTHTWKRLGWKTIVVLTSFVTALSMYIGFGHQKFKTIWLSVSHIGSNCKTNCIMYIIHVPSLKEIFHSMSMLCLWTSKINLKKWQPVGHIEPYHKTNQCAHVCHCIWSMYQVWKCLRNSYRWRTTYKSPSHTPSGGN